MVLSDEATRLWETAKALNRAAARVSPSAAGLPPLIFVTDPDRTPRPWEIAARLPAGAAARFKALAVSHNRVASSDRTMDSLVASALDTVRRRIAKAARSAGRDPSDITLTAVSKQQPEPAIQAALDAGQRVFGENRVQEAQGRWTERRTALPDLHLRLIGPLQSNKADQALALFDVIETLDREKLARALADAGMKAGVRPRVLIQLNTGEEPQKAGVLPAEADAFIARVRAEYDFDLQGLMCIPPLEEEPAMHFALLARIAARNGLDTLSMGMSGDYEAAVRFGATHVRVGSALFGARSGG